MMPFDPSLIASLRALVRRVGGPADGAGLLCVPDIGALAWIGALPGRPRDRERARHLRELAYLAP